MRFSRLGLIVLITFTILFGANCSYYNQIIARKNLVDGATAYKERKFAVAEQLFRDTLKRDPEVNTIEGKTAQLFLARTLHSEYIANRKDKPKAEEAIQVYKKVLVKDVADQSSFKAVANLLENLAPQASDENERKAKQDEWLQWITERATNPAVPPEQRAEALTLLAARKYSCANDISDVEPVKKTVKGVAQFTKPENPADFERLKQCTDEGMKLIDEALQLESQANQESDSIWSYKANLLNQKMRIAEMEGNKQEKDRLRTEFDVAAAKFKALKDEKKKKEDEEAARKKEAEAAANKK